MVIAGILAGKIPSLCRSLLERKMTKKEGTDIQPALPRFFLAAVYPLASDESGSQESLRAQMRPSSDGVSTGCQVGLWSNDSGSVPVGWRSWLNQLKSGSSSGIFSLIACHGGSMRFMVSISNGGGDGENELAMRNFVADRGGLCR